MRLLPTRSARSLRAQFIAAALVPALIVSLSVTGFVWAQKQVTVVVDGRVTHVASQARDVAGLLRHADITLGPGDIVTPPASADVSDGMTVVVRHAVPVKLHMDGTITSLDVVGKTVADALVAAGVDPDRNPGVTPSLATPLHAGLCITVPDSFVRVTQDGISIPAPAETYPDASLPKGSRRIIIQGADGLDLRVYREVVTRGIESSPTLVAEKIVSQPVKQVVAIGTGSESSPTHQLVAAQVREPAHWGGRTSQVGRHLNCFATAYSAAESNGMGGGSSTALGVPAVRGVVAVDPNFIPLGTHLYIPGYGFAIAADTGGMIHGRHIDLCFDTVAECNEWGTRPITVIILD